MAKIGELLLDKGMWDRRRIVSEGWIQESIRARFDVLYPHRYGHRWWVLE
jgi:CubicO group peptidase (beta-lactamase class C family)